MNKRILYKTPDGRVCVVIPAPEGRLSTQSEAEFIEFLISKDVPPDATDVIVVDDNFVSDRYFREAWDIKDGAFEINMTKAREVHMNKIRAARDKNLQAWDVETLKGRDVQTQKQALRDIPQAFDLSSATTPEELKALWPTELQ